MGNSILKGITAALGVTIITLLAGLFWTATGFEGLSTSTLVDIGLVVSCIAAGYVTGKESGQWVLGGVSSIGYVLLCVVLIAFFLELSAWGVIQVLAEGGLIGILSGAFGAGSAGRRYRPAGWRSPSYSSWADSYNSRDTYSSATRYGQAQEDDYVEDWDEFLDGNRKKTSEEQAWKEKKGWAKPSRQRGFSLDNQAGSDEEEWEKWQESKKNRSVEDCRKAWWEEDVL